MKLLVLDTSTERGIVACLEDNRILFSVKLPFGLQNSQHLLPEIERGFKEIGLRTAQLDGIVVGIGPGSYTGIRVGAIVAKTIAFACQLPIVGICTLETFLPPSDGVFATVIDARIGGVYLQINKLESGKVLTLQPRVVCSLAEAALLLQECPLLVTPNTQSLRPKLEAVASDAHWQWEERYPSAQHMAALGVKKLKEQEGIDSHLDLLYMRKTQAELEKSQSKTTTD